MKEPIAIIKEDPKEWANLKFRKITICGHPVYLEVPFDYYTGSQRDSEGRVALGFRGNDEGCWLWMERSRENEELSEELNNYKIKKDTGKSAEQRKVEALKRKLYGVQDELDQLLKEKE